MIVAVGAERRRQRLGLSLKDKVLPASIMAGRRDSRSQSQSAVK